MLGKKGSLPFKYQKCISHFLMCQNSLTFFKTNRIQQPLSTCEAISTSRICSASKNAQERHWALEQEREMISQGKEKNLVCSRVGKGCHPLICSAQSSLESLVEGNHCPGCMNQQPEDLVPPELLHRLSSIPFNLHQCSCFPPYLPTHSNKNTSVYKQLILLKAF